MAFMHAVKRDRNEQADRFVESGLMVQTASVPSASLCPLC
jgi:hypothetical protein